MRKTKQIEPKSGLFTEPMDVNTAEFIEFQAIVLNHSRAQTDWQKINIELTAIRIQMEDYIKSTHNTEPKMLGEFLKLYLDTLHIRQNKFAHYIDIEPSNLNKIIKGDRQITSEIALKIAKIFELDPLLLLEVQIKTELLNLMRKKINNSKQYSLKDLLKEPA
jgi:addiction module HigA family antidote